MGSTIPGFDPPMNKINHPRFVAAFAAFALLAYLPAVEADIPGLTHTDTIDPSLGTDAFGLTLLQVNHATHKLYTAGYPSNSSRNFGLKVVDTNSNTIIAGIDLGRYTGAYNGVWPLAMGIDESAAPVGDKVYLICRTDTGGGLLRTIDGPTNTNLTGEGTDIFLPVTDLASMAVNSSNHKIYVANSNGEIVVVDGPSRQILRVIDPNFGDLLVANPAANKIFVVNHNGGGVINSADDTFEPLLLFFTATAAALDSTHGIIYFVGQALGNSNSIFAVDATTGQIVGSKSGLVNAPLSVTVKPDENTVYVGSANDLLAFDGTTFAPKGNITRPAVKLACDPTASAGLYFVDTNRANSVIDLTFATGGTSTLTMGYRPFDVAVNNSTNRFYVTDEQTNELLEIDGANHAITNRTLLTPPFSNEPPLLQRYELHPAVSERLNRVYVPRTSYDSSANAYRSFVDVIDGGTNQVRSIALDSTIGSYSGRVAVDDTRRRIYVTASRQVGTFSAQFTLIGYDADTELPVTSVDLGVSFGPSLFGIAANPVTGRVYISLENGVVIVDGNTNTKVGVVNSVIGQIAINRRTNKIYVVSANILALGGGVKVINGATDSLETTVPIPNENDFAVGLDVDDVTNRVYLAHGSGRVTAYDANNNYQLLGQIDLGLDYAAGMAFGGAPRQMFVTHKLDGVVSVLQSAATAVPVELFGNISTRARVGGGDNVVIGGFIITGTQPRTVVVRGIGPSLPLAGALADPVIEVHGSAGELLATNDNWNDSLTRQQIIDSGLAPTNALESALWGIINPGTYTVVVRGANNATGVGLFEVYDLTRTLPGKLANISTRGHVDTGDSVMIAGVIIAGAKPVSVIVRAMGPSLTAVGVPNSLEDPVLELRDPNGGLVISNDNWQEHEAEVNATGLAPTDPRESAIVARLYPANYTAIVRGKNGATGVALVEAYDLNQ
jgi:DNA-binding beta-propeller fold protein YncE